MASNTVIEKILTGEFDEGDIEIAEFKQRFPVAPGKYTLSFSCTRYNSRGELEVLNRKKMSYLLKFYLLRKW